MHYAVLAIVSNGYPHIMRAPRALLTCPPLDAQQILRRFNVVVSAFDLHVLGLPPVQSEP